ncbi:miz zinc finger protein [Colletotrichum truncatum]|uniref:Miz zinc finger protein n=1 Tax=Colletotrichum truncatum TaxID=5467 RepID=A0ACC3ZDI4_COLTU|nr:miz zinc finger protein [Colletotrichum truncatum]KAF6794737.1 miz zinc finger protein [Colletotrichum truncatum]
MPPGAQQNSAGAFVAGAQVAASNQTLNAWMGGRQLSWMTSQNSTPAPKNRQKDSSRVGGPSSRIHGQPSSNNPLDSNPPNHGSVPTLHTRLTEASPDSAVESGKQIPDCAAALPSPAPTDQPSPPTATSNQPYQTRDSEARSPGIAHSQTPGQRSVTTASLARLSTQDQLATGHPQTSLKPDVRSPDLAQTGREPSKADRHSELRFVLNEDDGGARLSTASPSLQSRATNQSPVVSNTRLPSTPNLSFMPELRPSRSRDAAPVVSDLAQPSAAQLAFPQHSSAAQIPGQGHEVRRQAPEQSPFSLNLDCLRQQAMSSQLDKIVQLCGGPLNLPADNTTGPRLRLLRDAVNRSDYFYIVLHQILCVWSFRKEWVHAALNLDHAVIEGALNVLQNTLRKNDNMLRDHTLLFANFPESPTSGLWRSEFYHKYIGDVAAFLHCLHHQWNRVLIPSMRPKTGRGYPILASELHLQLRLRSPVLEPVFFTVTRRHMGIPDGPVADKMAEIFQKDLQTDYAKMPERDQGRARVELINRYKQLAFGVQSSQTSPVPAVQPLVQPGIAMLPTMGRQQQMVDPSRQFSSGHPTIQNAVTGQLAPRPAFGMRTSSSAQHSIDYPNNLMPMPAQLTLRSNNHITSGGEMQTALQSHRMPIPVIGGYFNQPMTPAGSPHHTNAQLPSISKMIQTPGHVSSVLQAPSGGIPVQLATVTSPTQSTAAPGFQHAFPPNGGFQGPQAHPGQHVPHQQTRHAHQIRQVNQANHQHQGHAMVPTNFPSMMSPRAHQISQLPVSQSNFHQLRPVYVENMLPQVLSASQAKSGRHRTSRPKGALFRPPQQHIPLDQMPHSPWEPKALAMALHQADVRSPRRVPRELPLKDDLLPRERYYQSIRNLAVGPVATRPRHELHRLVFTVPDGDFDKVSSPRLPIGEQIPVSEYFNGSLRYRLRLCELPLCESQQQTVPETIWAVAQTYWPDHISIIVNNQAMKIRRKQHNGQHQPVELTPFVSRGVNTISVGISPQSCAQRKANTTYFMAVEIIETLNHQSILDMVLKSGVISADTTRQSIQNRLKPVRGEDDDDVAVVDSDLSIDLADPFSSTIFRVPVRGVTCTHMECFDLGYWLQTRPAKPVCTLHSSGDACRRGCSNSDMGPEPSLVDKWKCPLCDGDARPYSLRMDSFMADVRTKLEKDGNLNTKTIYVAADGTWRPKVEEASDEDEDEDDEEGDEMPPAKRNKTGPLHPETTAVEIIELD